MARRSRVAAWTRPVAAQPLVESGRVAHPTVPHPAGAMHLVAAAYVYVQFSQMIILGFEGKRWSLSSKVYAEPESLYPGLPLRLDDLQASLERLGYRPVQALTNQGQYRINAPHVDIALREFRYPYRHEPARTIRVTFGRNSVREIRDLRGEQAIGAVDLEPQLVSEFFTPEREKRQLVKIADIPPHLIQAVIAIEDRRFYAHRGVDWIGILRAIYRNVRAGRRDGRGQHADAATGQEFLSHPQALDLAQGR